MTHDGGHIAHVEIERRPLATLSDLVRVSAGTGLTDRDILGGGRHCRSTRGPHLT